MKKIIEQLEPIICDCCGKITYSAKDVCGLLEIENVEKALMELDPEMKTKMVFGSDGENWDLSESDREDVVNLHGILAFVFQSQTLFAKTTQRRVMDEYVENIFPNSNNKTEATRC